MASTTEKGNAKNIANAFLLIEYITQLGANYNPNNDDILLPNLQSLYQLASNHQNHVNALMAPYVVAVDNRQLLFAQMNMLVSKLYKMFSVTPNVTQAHLDDFMTISRRIKGRRRTQVNPDQNSHSVAHMSYAQRLNNFDILISLLINTPSYQPHETQYQIASLQLYKAQLQQSTDLVNVALIELTEARSRNNHILYLSDHSLVDTFNLARAYLLAITDFHSVQYHAIAKIIFKKN